MVVLLLLHAHSHETGNCYKASNTIAVTEFELKLFGSCTLITQDLRLTKHDVMLCGRQRGILGSQLPQERQLEILQELSLRLYAQGERKVKITQDELL